MIRRGSAFIVECSTITETLQPIPSFGRMRIIGSRRRIGAATVLVAVALAVSGCTSGGSSAPASNASGKSVVSVAAMSAADLSSALAATGVATVPDESSAVPAAKVAGATGLRLTAWQVKNMAAQTRSHGGVTGADLDVAVPTPGAPPIAAIVVAWTIAGNDQAARTAGDLLGVPVGGRLDAGRVDALVFPQAVLMLFVADAVAHADVGTSSTGPSTNGAGGRHEYGPDQPGGGSIELADYVSEPAASGPCTAIISFVNDVLNRIFDSLKLDPATVAAYVSGTLGGGTLGAVVGGVAGWVAGFWNSLVDAGQVAAKAALGALTAPVLSILRIAIGGLGTITMVTSYLKQWSATITPDPTANRFAVGGESDRTGTFTVNVDTKAEVADWPAVVVDCATAVGVPLPTLTKAGLPVTWRVVGDEPGLVNADTAGPPLDDHLSSAIHYVTGRESVETAKGQLLTPTITATAQVRRTEIDQLRMLVTAFATAQVPGVIAPVVNPLITYYVELATQQLDRFTAVDGSVTVVISHHVPPTPTPKATANAGGGGNCSSTDGKTIPAGRYSGPVEGTVTTSLTVVVAAGNGSDHMSGAISIASDGKQVTGSMNLKGAGSADVGIAGAVTVNTTHFGSLVGTISGPASNPVIDGTLEGTDESGQHSSSFHAGLHVTNASCDSVSGDIVALFQEIAAPESQYLTIGGSAPWSVHRTS